MGSEQPLRVLKDAPPALTVPLNPLRPMLTRAFFPPTLAPIFERPTPFLPIVMRGLRIFMQHFRGNGSLLYPRGAALGNQLLPPASASPRENASEVNSYALNSAIAAGQRPAHKDRKHGQTRQGSKYPVSVLGQMKGKRLGMGPSQFQQAQTRQAGPSVRIVTTSRFQRVSETLEETHPITLISPAPHGGQWEQLKVAPLWDYVRTLANVRVCFYP